MLKEHAAFFRRMMILTDLVVVAVAFFLAYFLRAHLEGLFGLERYLWILPAVLVIWAGLLYYSSMYDSFRLKKTSEVLFIIGRSALVGFLIMSSLHYLFKTTYVSRYLIVLIFSLSAMLLSLEKMVLIEAFRYVRRKGYNFRNVLVIGSGKRAQTFIRDIRQTREYGLKVVGVLDRDKTEVGKTIEGCRVIGTLESLPRILRNRVIDQVMIIAPRSWLGEMEPLITECETFGIPVGLALDLFNLQSFRGYAENLLGLPLLNFKRRPERVGHLFIKRCFDLAVSFAALAILSPLFAVIAFWVKVSSPGPVFFCQKRYGLNGRVFTLYKFRTMVVDAETRLLQLLAYNEMEGPTFKMEKDPRVTKVGYFLRKFSLDELPQFWNVLKGDMSLVGPRPPISREIKQYHNWHRRRLSMRPGLTCLWQVMGRNRVKKFEDWMRLDLKYIDDWSLWLDLQILFRTIPVVFSGAGAK